MSLALLFNTRKPSMIGKIVLDAALSDHHEMENEVTEFPVEQGAPITDHIRNKPRAYTITGVVTNSPVVFLGAFGKSNTTGTNYVAEAFAKLEELWTKRELIDVSTPLKTYKDVAIESIEIDRTSRTGGSLPISIRVREIRRVTSQQVSFNAKKPKSGKAQETAKTGKQTPTAPVKPENLSFFEALRRALTFTPTP